MRVLALSYNARGEMLRRSGDKLIVVRLDNGKTVYESVARCIPQDDEAKKFLAEGK